MKTTPKKSTVEQIFNLYICSVTSEGVKDKTITTYNQDVDLDQRQIVLRHTKNGKLQVIPLCRSMVTILRDYIEFTGQVW